MEIKIIQVWGTAQNGAMVYKRPQTVAPTVNPDDDEKVLQGLNNVEKLIEQPISIIL